MAKVEVRIKYCCCLSLTQALILVAIYSFIYYVILLALASWGLSGTPPAGTDNGYYRYCLEEAKDLPADQKGVALGDDGSRVVVIADASSYHCSIALYTEELKYPASERYPVLIINIVIYLLMIICSVLIAVTIVTKIGWLLLPWIGVMCLDIVRGTISCIMIFVHSYNDLTRIAVGLFFLGTQIFHISLVIVIVAKFQRMHDKSRGIDYKSEKPPDKAYMVDGSQTYPTLPSHYGYSSSPHVRREGFYQPNYYNTYSSGLPRSTQDYGKQDTNGVYSSHYSTSYSTRPDYGRTM